MRQSQLFTKTRKEAPKDEVAKNAELLIRGGFVHKEMAGVYTILPLGLKVLTKIENIIRKHMDTVGNELLMTSLAPKELWEKTGRLDTVDVLMKTAPANKVSEDKSSNSYVLGSTHEEMITPIVSEYARSYKDLPCAFYQIQTKFRNEARAKSGLLRGREFRMKDLYSFHTDEEDLKKYYETVKKVYLDIFRDIGIGNDTFVTLASGGDFTKDFSHEFQTLCEAGEDLIYLDRENNIAYNKEVVTEENSKKLGVNFDSLEQVKACEVGNIFPLNTKFTKAFDYTYTNAEGKKMDVYMGSYGIGPTRLIGVVVEKFSDEKGIVWPEAVAPFDIHLIEVSSKEETVKHRCENLYGKLTANGAQVLWDDREIRAGEKFADADLIGIPYQVIVSDRGNAENMVEVKNRKTGETVVIPESQLISESISNLFS